MADGSFVTTRGLVTLAFMAVACSGSPSGTDGSSSGGSTTSAGGKSTSAATTGGASAANGGKATSSSGGKATGGATTGGTSSAPVGGTSTSGSKASGGATTGTSTATGGKASGGSGGTSSGGNANGGAATGGTSTATGGKANGGTGGTSSSSSKSTGGATMGGTSTATGGTSSTTKITLPTANASWDYEIGGIYTPPSGVKVVSRDRNSAPAAGLYNICYVNGFQIQPDEESFWTGQHPTLILRDSANKPVVDTAWNEMLLDTSTAAKRTELAAIVGGWITKCKTDGFNAVEIDNLDSYSRSSGLLTQANNIAFMAQLSAVAHQNGLAIAQKNSSELLGSVATMGTDFAVVEECNRYSECDTYTAAYGTLVFIIEYRLQDFQTGCTKYPQLSIVLRDLNVSTPSSSSYVYQGC